MTEDSRTTQGAVPLHTRRCDPTLRSSPENTAFISITQKKNISFLPPPPLLPSFHPRPAPQPDHGERHQQRPPARSPRGPGRPLQHHRRHRPAHRPRALFGFASKSGGAFEFLKLKSHKKVFQKYVADLQSSEESRKLRSNPEMTVVLTSPVGRRMTC